MGTGYYKGVVAQGVQYRSIFGYGGSCATLEDWVDPRRTQDDYVPTPFKPDGTKGFAVKGHLFRLNPSSKIKKVLIAFLKSLKSDKRMHAPYLES